MINGVRIRRTALLTAYSVLLIAVLVAMIITSLLTLTAKGVLADKLSEVADVIGSGTAVLAVLAGLIAIQAYAAATGLPKLEVQVWFSASEKNRPVFRARRVQSGMLEVSSSSPPQTKAIISLHNRSHYSAKSVTVVLRFSSITNNFNGDAMGDGWESFEFPDARFGLKDLTVQWTAGADGLVHGGASRRLPDLQLGSLAHDPSWTPPKLSVEMIADGGYRRQVELDIHFLDEDTGGFLDGGPSKSKDWI
jgi:hypothetical protein